MSVTVVGIYCRRGGGVQVWGSAGVVWREVRAPA
jgi:hypothetical protein